jgi:ketosteroid isomerase-like protein
MINQTAIILTIAVLFATVSSPLHTYPGKDTRQLLEKRQVDFFTALSAKDADKVAAFFIESSVLHIANRPPIEGRSAIRQFYSGLFGFLSASSATPEVLKVSQSGDMGYSYGKAVNTFTTPQGDVEYSGKYVLVWELIKDDWMIMFYSVSSNQPDPSR